VTRGDAPKLEIYPPTGRSLSVESRAKVMDLINAHTRDSLEEKDRLRIGFGALKNNAALTAVTGMLAELIEETNTASSRPMSFATSGAYRITNGTICANTSSVITTGRSGSAAVAIPR